MYKNLIGGLIGAIVLNVVHQLVKKIDDDAPQVDKIGMEALSKIIKAAGSKPPEGEKLFLAALGGDLVANATYFSLIGYGSKKHLLLRGLGFGALAGAGTLVLTKPLGLNDEPVNKTMSTQLMTCCWYVLGGIATALTLRVIKR